MGRMDSINARLSSMIGGDKRVIYFITEDRDFLQELCRSVAPTLKVMGGKQLKDKQWDSANFYGAMEKGGYLVDAYELLNLSNIKFDTGEKKKPALQSELQQPVFFYITDFHTLKKSNIAGEILKRFISYARERDNLNKPAYLLLLSPVLELPMGFEQDVEIIDVPEMAEEDILEQLQTAAAREVSGRALHPHELRRCREAAQDFKGNSRKEILQITRELRAEYGSFFGQQNRHDSEMLLDIQKSRKELISDNKKLSAKADSTVTLLEAKDAISGMDGYFDWLDSCRNDFLNPEDAKSWGINPPKGVLLTGVPGSGKTQAAKKTAWFLGENSERVSLVQLRMDNLLGSHVGDSEGNLKRCIKRTEALAPAVLLIDEIEKLFSNNTKDSSGVKTNLLAMLLDWLQENKKQIFFFATSNSVEDLPSELLRDGRFDMRFCSFMPCHKELVDIIVYYLKKTHEMSGEKKRFSRFEKRYAELAGQFLDSITKYAEETGRDMFFTGSNIENLINQTNQSLRSKGMEKPNMEEYRDLMLEKAKSDRCQPYGETNMESIVRFWILARKNKYASTSGQEVLPFACFDAESGKFDFSREKTNNQKAVPAMSYAYDSYMRERLSAEVEAAVQRERKK